ncbi:cobalamin-binding protein [Oceanimonas doudoroffii]|uniref:Cobalamin-binding protein n=1 Tax=Oceanimonas doudoroffii TaxID=84158 RepID=A0A233RAR2_9GAMM|nr:cobalamin-binding protein [Oceanimonas doudoroffii]OXY80476.1 cobalamin-binding protein [Oceanimonas doudoroffii]
MTKWLLCLLLVPCLAVAEPRRIVSLAPHITEILFAIGAGDQVVGVDEASDYPEAVARLPKIANYRSINLEGILALNPDLVIAWQSAQSLQVQPLIRLGIEVAYSEPKRLVDLGDDLERFGRLTGHEQQAAQVAAHYRRTLDALREQYRGVTSVSVFYQLNEVPLMSTSRHTWIGQAVSLCGGASITADSPTPYPQIDREFVLARNPEVILAESQQALNAWHAWPELTAVSRRQLFTINVDALHRFTPRTAGGIAALCRQLELARHSGQRLD